MKHYICWSCGLIGAGLSYLFGGFTESLIALLIFMVIDFITGLILSGVFHKSSKTENGALESKAGFKGLARKCTVLMFVTVGAQLDLLIDTNYIKDGICIAFIVNELISIVENAGLMGLPIPEIITKSIDILKTKHDGDINE